jgi:hypothetical protein
LPVILATQEAEIRRIVVLEPAQANISSKPFTKIGLFEWLKVKACVQALAPQKQKVVSEL